ncbi:hypothetical protein B0H17DRAFT_1340794 [Mycena rosella]|uniref:Uncharacterized protein n=1 Tax=Mycena rosella TaxID=1033263 RepID=A0AAD7BG30_MYCRO|nr:hypothetical protein B0H17DRAFT_1340794 [Mycena rosella]
MGASEYNQQPGTIVPQEYKEPWMLQMRVEVEEQFAGAGNLDFGNFTSDIELGHGQGNLSEAGTIVPEYWDYALDEKLMGEAQFAVGVNPTSETKVGHGYIAPPKVLDFQGQLLVHGNLSDFPIPAPSQGVPTASLSAPEFPLYESVATFDPSPYLVDHINESSTEIADCGVYFGAPEMSRDDGAFWAPKQETQMEDMMQGDVSNDLAEYQRQDEDRTLSRDPTPDLTVYTPRPDILGPNLRRRPRKSFDAKAARDLIFDLLADPWASVGELEQFNSPSFFGSISVENLDA